MRIRQFFLKKLGAVTAAAVFLFTYPACAQEGRAPQAYAETITERDLSAHLKIIASPAMEGRETGERGQKRAANYLAKYFKKVGLKPVNQAKGLSGYFQRVPMLRSATKGAYIKKGAEHWRYGKDFYYKGNFKTTGEEQARLTLCGYGIDTENYSDYRGKDVKDKYVIVFAGEPTDAQGGYFIEGSHPSEWSANWVKKAKTAADRGAKGIVFIANTNEEYDSVYTVNKSRFEKPGLSFDDGKPSPYNSFYMPPRTAARLLGIDEKTLTGIRERIGRDRKTHEEVLKSDVMLNVERRESRFTTENVLGILEGSDKKDEYIFITAHYDHLGKFEGKIYPGADDDGSGTVSLLELAEAFTKAKKAGRGPRRSIVFLAFTGEEKGLLGSRYYVEHPVVPLSQTVANLNIDMIGRTDERHKDSTNYIYLIGSDKLSSQLHRISEEANATHTRLTLDYSYNDENDPEQFYYRSDHYNFAKNGIPVIFYFSGVHEDYHQPGDTVDKIMFDLLRRRALLVFYTAWSLANREERIAVDSNKR